MRINMLQLCQSWLSKEDFAKWLQMPRNKLNIFTIYSVVKEIKTKEEYKKETRRIYRKKNATILKEQRAKYYINNKEWEDFVHKQYYTNNKVKINKRTKVLQEEKKAAKLALIESFTTTSAKGKYGTLSKLTPIQRAAYRRLSNRLYADRMKLGIKRKSTVLELKSVLAFVLFASPASLQPIKKKSKK